MNWLSQHPIIRLFVPFLTGVILCIKFPEFQIPIYIPIIFLSISFLLANYIQKKRKYNYRYLPGIFFFLMFFFLGCFLVTQKNPTNNPSHITKKSTTNQAFWKVRVVQSAEEKKNSVQTTVKILNSFDSTYTNFYQSKALFYFKKDSLARELQIGDELIVKTRLNLVEAPKNPYEFHYQKYLSAKGIYHQAFIKSKEYSVVARKKTLFIKQTASKFRNKLLDILHEQGIEGKEYAVVSAILLGYKEKLDSELQKDFVGAGAMHILCVSGLHVGIIYTIISMLLFSLNRNKKLKLLKSLIVLVCIWSYALVTGLAPSVMRASIMFSFISIGQNLGRKTNIYNSLIASAFVLILINPFIVQEVGFQLSYLAVLGIVAIYPHLYNRFYIKNWLSDKIWALVCVSIAAQIGTFPLSLFYFHQFPLLFFITNIVVIPIVSLMIWTGVIVLGLSFLHLSFLPKILSLEIKSLNYFVGWIESLPFSSVRGISINVYEMLILYVLIIFIVAFLLSKKPRIFAYASLCFVTLLSFFWIVQNQNVLRQKKVIVYSVNNTTAIDFISGRGHILLSDSTLSQSKISFHLLNNWYKLRLKNKQQISLNDINYQTKHFYKHNNFIKFYEKTMFVATDATKYKNVDKKITVNYLVITNDVKLTIRNFSEFLDFEKVIFDGSNTYWYKNKRKKECDEFGFEYYDVKESGAYEIEL